ncbi:hypothetical protein OH76DRAFT_1352245 [Lentinus brumalis]|uniref:F-box domain-containing protein n=1 Tax=Lentinus brumalis TaxID=2498619 RepID=A0A371D7E3_9APHY|nr:hypothetical protein OH76DRAFT_1352245 [Polyporus brumalis]
MEQNLVNDVLVSLMEISNPRTISALMKTCRHLYHSGPRYLLARGVTIKRESVFESFLAFLRADDGGRLKYFKELTMRLPFGITYPIANVFSTFLVEHADELVLQTLRIGHAEALLGSGSPPLCYAFAKIKTITKLDIEEVGKHGALFLRTMECELETACLTMPRESTDSDDSDGDIEEDDQDDRNGIKLLHGSQNTLKSLTGRGFELFAEITDPVYSQIYPHVAQLVLFGNDWPATIVYAHSFPNLRVFRYETAEEDLDIIGRDLEAHVDIRALNQMQQAQLKSPWKSLDACHANLIDLFLLGLRCHVRELHILGNFMDPVYLRNVMMDTTPEYMCLQGFDVNIITPRLISTMKKPYAQQLRSLEIVLLIGGMLEPETIDMPRVVETMLNILRPLKIRSFGVLLCCCLVPEPRPANLADLPLCPAEQYLADLDLDAFAQRIKDTTETLQTVVITLKMHRTRPTTIVTLGADVEYEPEAVERIPLRGALLYAALPSIYPEQGSKS